MFWSWFTLGERFPKWQRNLALGWLLVVGATFAITWSQMSERYFLMSFGLPIISFHLSLWLWVWLVFRVMRPSCLDLMIWYFIAGGALGGLAPDVRAYLRGLPSQEFNIYYAMGPLLPALLHLLVMLIRDYETRRTFRITRI